MSKQTAVIFRKFKDGQVIALFPYIAGDVNGWLCESFIHVGQHGQADPNVTRFTKRATPDEYAPLKRELESAPYRYNLRVLSRIPSDAWRVRKDQVAR